MKKSTRKPNRPSSLHSAQFHLRLNFGSYFERHDVPRFPEPKKVPTYRFNAKQQYELYKEKIEKIERIGGHNIGKKIEAANTEVEKLRSKALHKRKAAAELVQKAATKRLPETKNADEARDLLFKLANEQGKDIREDKELMKILATELEAEGFDTMAENLEAETSQLEAQFVVLEDYGELAELWRIAPHWSNQQQLRIAKKVHVYHDWLSLYLHETELDWEQGRNLWIHFKKLLWFLTERMQRGDEMAARLMGDLAIHATRELNNLSAHNSELFRRTQAEVATWPVLRSPHRKFSQDDDDFISHVGKNFPYRIEAISRSNPNDYATRVAMELAAYLFKRLEQCALPKWSGGGESLDKKDVDRWWEKARHMLGEHYDFNRGEESVERLRTLSPNAKGPREQQKESRIRAEILERVREKFEQILGWKHDIPA